MTASLECSKQTCWLRPNTCSICMQTLHNVVCGFGIFVIYHDMYACELLLDQEFGSKPVRLLVARLGTALYAPVVALPCETSCSTAEHKSAVVLPCMYQSWSITKCLLSTRK